jgi:integral membrane protein (TIGR00529 family)
LAIDPGKHYLMEWFDHIPALVKIFGALGVVLLGLKCKIPLSIALIVGSGFLGIFFRMPLPSFFKASVNGIVSTDTFSLALIVMGILLLSHAMAMAGRLERIVTSFKKLVGESRITLVTFPALIGLLPMPGGAVFSAPMVGAMSQNSTLLPHHKTIINYWFRHIWEYWFPLYPGVILALSLTNIPAWKFILLNCPMTLVALGAGYLITLHHVSLGDKKHRDYTRQNVVGFLKELIPIFLVVFSLLLLGIGINIVEGAFGFKSNLLERAPIFIGLILSLSWVVLGDKLSWRNVRSIVLKRPIWEMGLLVVAIMLFRSILEQSGGVKILRDELLTYKIPVVALIMALPFITGIVTGIAVGFVGTSFPLVIALIATMNISTLPEQAGAHIGALIFIAYVFGFLGMMLSPVHLCLLLTKDYFKASLLRVYYQYLVPLAALTSIPALLLFALYRSLQF